MPYRYERRKIDGTTVDFRLLDPIRSSDCRRSRYCYVMAATCTIRRDATFDIAVRNGGPALLIYYYVR